MNNTWSTSGSSWLVHTERIQPPQSWHSSLHRFHSQRVALSSHMIPPHRSGGKGAEVTLKHSNVAKEKEGSPGFLYMPVCSSFRLAVPHACNSPGEGAGPSSCCTTLVVLMETQEFDLHRRGQHTARLTQTLNRESEHNKTVCYVFAALEALNEPNQTALLIQQMPV